MDTQTKTFDLACNRVLITGAGGFLGSHLVERLTSLGAEVMGISRSRGNLDLLPPSICSFKACDLRDREAIAHVCRSFRPQIVFHLASQRDASEGYSQAKACVEGNLAATLNVLDAACESGASSFIYGDSCKVYGNCDVPFRESMPARPLSSYAATKAAGWEYCLLYARLHEIAVVSIRPTIIYGPRQSFNLVTHVTESVMAGRGEIRLDGGSQTRDPLYIDDAIEAFIFAGRSAAQLRGRVINIGGGHEITVADLARETLKALDRQLPIICDSSRRRLTETQRSYCDNAEARELLAWTPRIGLNEGLRQTVEFLMATKAMPYAVNQ
jgi:nucleoside-diphosphate-sugar epimerase